MSEALREELRTWIHATFCDLLEDVSTDWGGQTCDDYADALLTGPLAPLLAKLQAVEALIPDWEWMAQEANALVEEIPESPAAPYLRGQGATWTVVSRSLRRALDGEA